MVWIKDFQVQFDTFAKASRLRTLQLICFIGASAALLNFIVRLFYFKGLNANLWTILGTSFFLFWLGAWTAWKGDTNKAAKILNWFCFIFVPLRIYQSSGVYSPVLYLYLFHCSFVVALYGREAGVKLLYWSMFSVLIFGALGGWLEMLPQDPFYENQILNGIGHLMVLMLTTILIIQLGKESALVSSYLIKLEQKRNAYKLMRDYTVRSSPAIVKSIALLDRLDNGFDRDAIFEVESGLKEIQHALKKLAKDSRDAQAFQETEPRRRP